MKVNSEMNVYIPIIEMVEYIVNLGTSMCKQFN